MSLHDFTSRIQKSVIFDPRFTGIKAKYSRTRYHQEGELEFDKSIELYVSPQGNYVATDRQHKNIGTRINVIWAKTEDLKFDGEPFLPMDGDIIEYKVNDVLHKYIVAKVHDMQVQSSYGQSATFSYEDGLHGIIKINTLKQQ